MVGFLVASVFLGGVYSPQLFPYILVRKRFGYETARSTKWFEIPPQKTLEGFFYETQPNAETESGPKGPPFSYGQSYSPWWFCFPES
jgi:hypothetical protein